MRNINELFFKAYLKLVGDFYIKWLRIPPLCIWRKGRRKTWREEGREGGREGGGKGGREGGREREIGRGKGSHQQYSQVPTCTGFNYLIVMF